MTPDELIKGLKDAKKALRQNAGTVLFTALKSVEGEYKFRIFDEGYNADEQPIGDYVSENWIEERQNRGLQVDYVDLQFTGKLRRSIKVQKSRYDAVMAIPDNAEFEKAEDQEVLQGEKSYGRGKVMDIFTLSDSEIAIAEKNMLKELDKLIPILA